MFIWGMCTTSSPQPVSRMRVWSRRTYRSFFDTRADVTPADVVALCSAVATAQVRLQLGIVGQRVWAVETWIALHPDRQVRVLHGSSGQIRLVKLLYRWGYGALRTVTFAPWC